jgi:hypothetical protein
MTVRGECDLSAIRITIHGQGREGMEVESDAVAGAWKRYLEVMIV